uniref:Uncharacterized protein n=1 Tax=Physcomitrium patens TaxID=3218 RepID=A0A2K1KVE9_PHYPA|nr:hypothetical protein PHYPA_004753 [Physcomitrium patens]
MVERARGSAYVLEFTSFHEDSKNWGQDSLNRVRVSHSLLLIRVGLMLYT